MRICLIAVGQRMPKWVATAFDDYARRLPRECRLELIEIPAGTRKYADDANRAVAAEDTRMARAIERDHEVIALTINGQAWSTERLAGDLKRWMGDGRDRSILIGGPNGLGRQSLAAADQQRALSQMTLPHPLVRVIIAEQLFRAHSILIGHPYHRG